MTAAGAQVVDGAAVTKTAEVLRVAVVGNGDDLTEKSVPTLVISSPSGWSQVILEATRLGAGRLRLALGPGDEAAAHTAAACRELVARGFDVVVETAAPGAAEPVLVPAAAWLAVLGLPLPELPGAPADAPAPPTAPVPTRAFPATDTGNAERLAAAFGADLRHTGTTWVVWDGRRWAEDRTGGEIARRAKATVRTIRAEASTCTNDTAARALDRWGVASESRGRLSAMVALARHEPGLSVDPQQLDADRWALNCLNGTVDLRTGTLRPHDRHDLITALAPVVYDPDAQLDVWGRFLRQATGGDLELESFLARLVGYSLTGLTSEEVMALVHGPGGSGKSSFIEAIKATLGPDYARTADFETFLERKSAGGPRSDVADLAGARFVASIEVDEGKRLASALVKTLTGSDTVRARRIYQASFEYRPQFALWLVANHAPRISSADSGLWRRVLRVPFEHVVPVDQRDAGVKATLCDPAVAGPAILAWAVRGCLDWQGSGLRVPDTVTKATGVYRQDNDDLGGFLEARCVAGDRHWASSAALRAAYVAWCEANSTPALGAKVFGAALAERGFRPAKRRVGGGEAVRGWAGLSLSDEDPLPVTAH